MATPWYNNDWSHRQSITISPDGITDDLTAKYVSITQEGFFKAGFKNDIFDIANTDGSDIVVTSSDGVTTLTYEVISYDTNANTFQINVSIPVISSSAPTEFILYFGNTSATIAPQGLTWDQANLVAPSYTLGSLEQDYERFGLGGSGNLNPVYGSASGGGAMGFRPNKPLYLVNEGPSKDSELFSKLSAESTDRGGAICHVWMYEGIFNQTNEQGETKTMLDGSGNGIQDNILMENRDRRYADSPVTMRGIYAAPDNTLDYGMFGSMLGGDVIQIEFSKRRMLELCGRKLINGDVIELAFMAEAGDLDGSWATRFYTVDNISRSPAGYDYTYQHHMYGVTARPIQDAQEFIDIMEREDATGSPLRDNISNRQAIMDHTALVQNAAEEQAYTTWFDTTILFVNDLDKVTSWRFSDDAVPPNGHQAEQVSKFPTTAEEGQYVVRVDFFPARLFRFQEGQWVLKEIDSKRDWLPYNWTNTLRDYSTDRSLEDDLKPWEHISTHDIATPRQGRSIPSPRGAHAAPRRVFDWDRKLKQAPPLLAVIDSTVRIAELFPEDTPTEIATLLNAGQGEFSGFYIFYSVKRLGIQQAGEMLIVDNGTELVVDHEFSTVPSDGDELGITFSVGYENGERKLYYTLNGSGVAEMKYFVEGKW